MKYIPRTVRYTFPRDTTTAKFELPPFWNTAVNFTGCKRINCAETTFVILLVISINTLIIALIYVSCRFSDEDNKVEAESFAILVRTSD